MFHRMDDVAGSSFALGADHRSALGYAAERLAQVTRAANKRRGESMLVDVMSLIGWSKNLRLVNEVNADRLQHLRFHKMTDASLGHHRDRNRAHNLLDELGIRHARNAAFSPDH